MKEKIVMREISPWGIGERVICINNDFKTAPREIRATNAFPKAGRTYTIRDVFDDRSPDGKLLRTSFHVEEIVNEPIALPQHGNSKTEISFLDTNFKAESHLFRHNNPVLTEEMLAQLHAQIINERNG
jgi:hypothetical protein